MFGMLGYRSAPVGGGGASGDLIPDPDFDRPADWNTNGNAAISGGTITSLFSDTPAAVPTIATLTAPTESGATYLLTIVALGNPLDGRAQTRLYNSSNGASQLVYNGQPVSATVEVPITANGTYDQVRIIWTEEAMVLDRFSLVAVAPSLEMVRDAGFDHPEFWETEGFGGAGSIVSSGEIVSINDDGEKPATCAFKDGQRMVIGQSYRCRSQVLSNRSGPFRLIALDTDTGDEQIMVQTNDNAQLVDVTFVATVAGTHFRIRFFEISIRLGSASLFPAAGESEL